jgi:hypothetical protein
MRHEHFLQRLSPAASLYLSLYASLGRSLAAGARMIERQEGYPPGRLMFGGLVAWILCLGLMLVVAGAGPVLRYATSCLALHCLG